MEIIAMGELRAYLKTELPKYDDPVIFISTNFFPGCYKCKSSATVYYIKLTEKNLIPDKINIQKAQNHKFPIDIYVNYPIKKELPKKIVIGTKKSNGKLEMILRRIIE